MIEQGLTEMEDYYLAAATVARVRNGQEKTYSTEQVRKHLGLED
jgi:RHH-type rel operon transcriptional repressor/antitoxin RelB